MKLSLRSVNKSEKLVALLQWVYSLTILGLPIYSVVYVHTNQAALAIVSEFELHFLQSSYFLVVLFVLFMLVLLHEYLPDTLTGMLDILLVPIVIITIQALFSPSSIPEYLARAGMLHITTIILAFVLLVGYIFLVGLIGNIISKSFDSDSILGLIVMCGAQLLFIIPGCGAIYIFSKYIFLHDILPLSATNSVWHPAVLLSIGLYLFSIVNTTWVFGRKLKSESIIGE